MPGMDALLDSSDHGVLAGKNIEAEPCGRGYPTILLVTNDLEQLGCAVAPLWHFDAAEWAVRHNGGYSVC